MSTNINNTPINFIRNIVEEDLAKHKYNEIITRFPPEPNGYLHIGHAKAICHNFGLAKDYNGRCNLRFDDTNPDKESLEYVVSIKRDIEWLGFSWTGEVKYASDYFDKLYEFAIWFIKQGLAYVDDLLSHEIREYRGTLTEPGQDSPYRNREVMENLTLFQQMKEGLFPDGAKVLRLKIDMKSANMNLRDPVIYRIKRAHHIRTGDKWLIYPMYDYTHCISDALEGITHSCCSLEFEDHRPLYDWVVDKLYTAGLVLSRPRQIEFSRLELGYTITSKRKLNLLVSNGYVDGWDDPRMPTISGMRRRGYPAAGIKLFINRAGVSKAPNYMDLSYLEGAIRETLEPSSPRVMVVCNKLKVVLTNFNPNDTFSKEAAFHPELTEYGSRVCNLTSDIYIEKEDFQEVPEKGFQRLTLNGEVRLRHSYIIRCDQVIKDAAGEVIELRCSLDKDTLGKNPVDRKVKGVIHWVSASLCIPCELRLYARLFTESLPDKMENRDFLEFINPNSLTIIKGYAESSLASAKQGVVYQFERIAYFTLDNKIAESNLLVFNKTVSLKDSWKKH